ncbi:SH3 domain-containing protein [Algirhabdus cladophorae]|uniref:SH3 domain-containing protein n=1 Tax=Algirhabdus cladophorae TaxID=3377108 RepID=UPI003B8459DD
MWRFIVCSFAFMGWGFYELSGGSEFEPEQQRAAIFAPVEIKQEPTDVADSTPAPIEAAVPQAEVVLASLTTRAAVTPTLHTTALVDSQKAAAVIDQAVEEAIANITPVVAPVVAAPTPALDIRRVKPARVNVRGGPGTDYDIVAKLVQGDEATILSDNGDGWLEVEMLDGQIGWMASFLLVASN